MDKPEDVSTAAGSASRRSSSPGTPPPPSEASVELWLVVGGAEKGGLIVRAERSLSSPQLQKRLATRAVVRRLALEEGRLKFALVSGSGPGSGWVSLRAGGKELLQPHKAEAVLPAAAKPASRAEPKAKVEERPQKPQGSAVQKAASVAVKQEEVIPPPTGNLVASLQYLADDGKRPFFYFYPREDGGEQTHGEFVDCEVNMYDGRPEAAQLCLDTHGVMLVPHKTALSTYDFYERPERVWSKYYDEMRELIQKVTGARRVFVFDHNVRNPREAKWRRGVIGYVPYAHNDYTDESAPKRVEDVAKGEKIAGEELEGLLKGRFVIINVWRNISEKPIAADPLAVADGRTVKEESYVKTDLIYRDRVGQTYSVIEDEEHRWLYFSGMRKDEALLMKCWDSQPRPGTVAYTAHTGFVDPRSRPDAPQRESVDARCIAFFDDKDSDCMGEPACTLFPDTFDSAAGGS